MCKNISKWLTVDYLISYKVPPTACHICFRHKSTTLVYVLDIVIHSLVIHSLYAQIISVNVLLLPDVCSLIYSVSYCCVCYCTSLTNIWVCYHNVH